MAFKYPDLPDEEICYCPVCRAVLGSGDTVYIDSHGCVAGCEVCLRPVQACQMYEDREA